jgi:glutamine synthetase
MFGYSWVRSGQDSDLMQSILDGLAAFDIELEGLHTETGPGVYEAAIRYDDVLRAADKAALFKPVLKQIAHRHGLSVTFMAKWNADLPGCSGHLHQSLWQNGRNVFFERGASRSMSKVMQSYIAGQMALMQELTALYSPTINSYKRYVPGVWAPLVASWGEENRTCAIRLIDLGTEKGQRVEYRQTAADINPYVAMAACLGAGLYGIEKQLELPPETKGDPGVDGPGRLPRTLREANQRLAASRAAKSLFGAEFVDHYVRTRDWEVRAYERAVTDWELRRYFEII